MKASYDGSDMWRMERGMTAKRVYVREFAGSRSVGRLRKRWLDTLNEYLKKRFGCPASKEGHVEVKRKW